MAYPRIPTTFMSRIAIAFAIAGCLPSPSPKPTPLDGTVDCSGMTCGSGQMCIEQNTAPNTQDYTYSCEDVPAGCKVYNCSDAPGGQGTGCSECLLTLCAGARHYVEGRTLTCDMI